MKTPAMYNLLRKAGPALHALALMIGILLAGSVHAQTIIYVDQTSTGNGDGSAWVDAFNHLQDALDASEAGNEIWIASGTYLPGDSLQARFVVSKDVRIYGGFAGAETSLDEREPLVYPTILSGDVLGDDLPSNTQDNRWTICTRSWKSPRMSRLQRSLMVLSFAEVMPTGTMFISPMPGEVPSSVPDHPRSGDACLQTISRKNAVGPSTSNRTTRMICLSRIVFLKAIDQMRMVGQSLSIRRLEPESSLNRVLFH